MADWPPSSPVMQSLDVGWGPGSITLGLAGVVAPGQVVGIDIQSALIIAGIRDPDRGGSLRAPTTPLHDSVVAEIGLGRASGRFLRDNMVRSPWLGEQVKLKERE